MIKTNGKYKPDIAIPPGETLLEVIESKLLSQKELADRTGLTQKTINLIIKGNAPLTPDTALKLENVLNIPANFWNNLEKNYQETLLRLKLEKDSESEEWILNEIHYSELVKLRWIPRAGSLPEKINNLRNYFGVASLENLKTVHSALFRKSCTQNASHYALVGWIEKGKKEALNIETKNYNKNFLKSNIDKFRELTLIDDPEEFHPKLSRLCADCGIAFVVLQHLSKTYANGATQWINSDKALLLLSIRYKFIDIFWFSFFHELGHILLHGKKEVFIECNDDKNEYEEEADRFASEVLIDNKEYKVFLNNDDFNKESILKFADKIKIHPAIIIGRLAHDKKVNYSKFNYLIPRLKFKV
jgi:HTH-type transcriptional regulator / antitoxin HigA